MFITHLLFSSPRLRFSEAQKKAVLGWAVSLKAPNVPTLHALKKCQSHIQQLVGNPTEKVTSLNGNVFHLNDVGSAIAKAILFIFCSALGTYCFFRITPTRWLVLRCPTMQLMAEQGCAVFIMDQK